jgi:2-oxoglutarate dehydrogenase E2 component (dihydrolipoamide succinyltransferase)
MSSSNTEIWWWWCCGVAQTINALGKKARDGTISIDDMAGGTFTISNGGVYGSLLSTPIVNPPQVGPHGSKMVDLFDQSESGEFTGNSLVCFCHDF